MSPNRKKMLIHLLISVLLPLFIAGYLILCAAGRGIPCFFERNFQILCPSCGATRAFQRLLQMDLSGAVNCNGFFALGLYPILFIIYLQDLVITLANLWRNDNRTSFLFHLFGKRENVS